jgi:uncharacterized membrane protein
MDSKTTAFLFHEIIWSPTARISVVIQAGDPATMKRRSLRAGAK